MKTTHILIAAAVLFLLFKTRGSQQKGTTTLQNTTGPMGAVRDPITGQMGMAPIGYQGG